MKWLWRFLIIYCVVIIYGEVGGLSVGSPWMAPLRLAILFITLLLLVKV